MGAPASVAVVIPARNEAEQLLGVLDRLKAVPQAGFQMRIIVVDDASTDATAEVARAAGAEVLNLTMNLGMGGAVRTGCDAAVLGGSEVIVTCDADGQHRPEDIPALVNPIIDGTSDLTYGVRSFGGEMPWLYRFGNFVLNLNLLLLFGIRTRDSQCGFRAFRADVYPHIRWSSRGYAIASEIMVRTAQARLRHTGIPIPTIYHDRYKGTQPSDGVRIVWQTIKWRFGIAAAEPVPASEAVGNT